MRDAYLAARFDDIRVVGTRLIRNLTKTPFEAFAQLPEGTVILAEELTPADTALMDPQRVAGFATVLGGAESHTSIMARALGLPAVRRLRRPAHRAGAARDGDRRRHRPAPSSSIRAPATVARYTRAARRDARASGASSTSCAACRR